MQGSTNESRPLRRSQELKEELLSRKPQMCHERALIYTRVYKETESEPMIVRRAKAFRTWLAEMSIYILDGELIVGNEASTPRSAPIYPETEAFYLLAEGLDTFETREQDPMWT